jgi:hypothetical protein
MMKRGLEKIQDLEDASRLSRVVKEEELTKQAPVFTKPLEDVDGLKEGESVHFEARLTPTNDPRLKVGKDKLETFPCLIVVAYVEESVMSMVLELEMHT